MEYIAINYSNIYATETLLILWDVRNYFSFQHLISLFKLNNNFLYKEMEKSF
jgi:hypothetical protein